IVGQRALVGNAHRTGLAEPAQHPLSSAVTPATSLVLLRMPRSLDRLDAVARAVAAVAGPHLVLLAGNRVKHMTPTQNEVLAASFTRVDVTHARAKSRIILGREPRAGVTLATPAVTRAEYRPGGGSNSSRRVDASPSDAAVPPADGASPAIVAARATAPDGLTVVAVPGVFAGANLDIGTRELLATFHELPPLARAIDLACGPGTLAVARAHTPGPACSRPTSRRSRWSRRASPPRRTASRSRRGTTTASRPSPPRAPTSWCSTRHSTQAPP